jgi:hypothetical protein
VSATVLGGQADCGVDEGVEDDHELAHGGGERELLGFAGGDQAQAEGAQRRVVPDRDRGRHVERRDGAAIELADLGQKREKRGNNPFSVLRCLALVTSR